MNLSGSTNISFHGNYFTSCQGFIYDSGSKNLNIYSNRFNYTTLGFAAIQLGGSQQVLINGNWFNNTVRYTGGAVNAIFSPDLLNNVRRSRSRC